MGFFLQKWTCIVFPIFALIAVYLNHTDFTCFNKTWWSCSPALFEKYSKSTVCYNSSNNIWIYVQINLYKMCDLVIIISPSFYITVLIVCFFTFKIIIVIIIIRSQIFLCSIRYLYPTVCLVLMLWDFCIGCAPSFKCMVKCVYFCATTLCG